MRALLLSLILIAPLPATAADLKEGEKTVDTICADCHGVGGRPSRERKAPTMSSIASKPDNSPAKLQKVLGGEHDKVGKDKPPFTLTPPQIENVIAYIATLK